MSLRILLIGAVLHASRGLWHPNRAEPGIRFHILTRNRRSSAGSPTLFLGSISVGPEFAEDSHDFLKGCSICLARSPIDELDSLVLSDDQGCRISDFEGVMPQPVIKTIRLSDGTIFVEQEWKRHRVGAKVFLRLPYAVSFFCGDVHELSTELSDFVFS